MAFLKRTILVTGSSTGIGEACALSLDRSGHRVFAGVRRPEDGERLASQSSNRFRWIALDVTDEAGVREAVRTMRHALGEGRGLDGVVNNAGIAVAAPLETVSLEAFQHQFEVNVFGLLRVTQHVLPLIRLAPPGRIVNIGSIAGRVASPMLGAYCASKFAVEAMSDTLRLEVKGEGIQVSLIEPGVVFTPIWEKSMAAAESNEAQMSPEGRARYADLTSAVRRLATHPRRPGVAPEVVARAVVHALTATHPRTRYLIGRDARIRNLLRLLPDRWHDRIVQAAVARLAARAKKP